MAQRNKQQRKAGMQGAPLAGSSSRGGVDDPRHRRGAQAEMEVEQRFDPDDFEVDDEQRVTLKKSGVAAQAVCVGCPTNAIAGANTYVTMELDAATTSTGDFLTVDTSGDHISLRGGHVYMVSVDVLFRNSDNSNQRSGTVKIQATGGTNYGERSVLISAASDEHGGTRDFGASAFLSAVVDLTGSGALDIDFQVKGNDTEISAGGGWITVQRLG